MDTQQIKDAVAEALPATIEDLKTLVAIESISASPAHQGKVAESAQADGSIPMIADLPRGIR